MIERDKQDSACGIVLGNRISWSTYDKVRKAEGLTPPQKRSVTDQISEEPTKKRRHGNIGIINQNQLLEEATSWPSHHSVNWSSLARKYGIETPNGGQILNVFLREHSVPVAQLEQRPTRAPRSSKKRIGSVRVSFPMYPTVASQRQTIKHRTEVGDIDIGREVVTTTYSKYSVNKHTHSVIIDDVEVSARKFPLQKIREKLLQKHDALGIVRDLSTEYFEALSTNQVIARLQQLAIPHKTDESSTALRKCLIEMSRKRYIKIWHDHSSISAHGHLLVLVSIIYDPAFFYTSEEMKNFKGVEIDVPTIVGKPEVYILGRSTSSTVDQLHFIATRRECLQDISILHTRTGTPVCDVVRFFYGDGPAAQFEAGHKQGGTYCCTGCKADSCRFSEIAYCYRAAKHTLKERQEFLLQGKVWKKGGE